MGGAAIKCGEEDLQGAKLCILSVTCIQGLRWGVQPSNVERRIYKRPSYAYSSMYRGGGLGRSSSINNYGKKALPWCLGVYAVVY